MKLTLSDFATSYIWTALYLLSARASCNISTMPTIVLKLLTEVSRYSLLKVVIKHLNT